MFDYYKSHRKGRRREIKPTEEMQRLVPTSRIATNAEVDTVYIYNGKEKPIKGSIGDPITTTSVLKPKIMNTFRLEENAVVQWCGLLNDLLLKELEKNPDLEDDQDDQQDRRLFYIHKYTPKEGRLIEAVIVGGRAYFIQMKEGLDFDLLPEYYDGNKVYKPTEGNSDLCKSYVFKDKEEISYYLKLASKLTANQNFDPIFKLNKTIFMKYVVLDDHYATLLVADIIYSYFQDNFATTHYDFCLGDNGSGKNSILKVFHELAYRNLLAGGVSGPNVFTALGSIEGCQCTIAEDEADNLDNEHDKMNIYKTGYSAEGRIPKTDLNSGRRQDLFHTYCFKIFASESSLDNKKAKGFLDRCFEIPCLVGRPTYNIKKVVEKNKEI